MTILGWHVPDLYLSHGLEIITILALTAIAMRLVTGLVRRWIGASGTVPAASIFVNISRVTVVIVGAVFILDVLHISITPVITALGVGGLAVALALQDTLHNLFSGLQIVASRQIRPGDYLLLDTGQEGTVEDVAWRTTTLRTQSDNLVIVPNGKLAQAIVTNYRLPAESVATTVEFGVDYSANLDAVERIVTEVAEKVMADAGETGGAPIVRFKAFGDSQIVCAAVLRVSGYGDQFPLRSAFVKELHARFTAEGIAFPTPSRKVELVRE